MMIKRKRFLLALTTFLSMFIFGVLCSLVTPWTASDDLWFSAICGVVFGLTAMALILMWNKLELGDKHNLKTEEPKKAPPL